MIPLPILLPDVNVYSNQRPPETSARTPQYKIRSKEVQFKTESLLVTEPTLANREMNGSDFKHRHYSILTSPIMML